MLIEDFIAVYPKFYKEDPELLTYWRDVQSQAARHMRRMERNDLFDINRPNESEQVKDFRDDVRRDITSEGTWKWIAKVSRIFVEHGITLDQSTVSDSLNEWLEEKPFRVKGRPITMNSFMYQLVLPMMIEDPNAVLLPFPTVPGDPYTPPIAPETEGGVPSNQKVEPINIFVSSGKIQWHDNDIFAWNAGQWTVDKDHEEPYYFLVDHEKYARYIPVKSATGNSGFTYELELWYFHDLKKLPVNVLGGVASRPGDVRFYSEDRGSFDEMDLYFESFLRSYYELADEVVMAFSDNQAVRMQHNHPKMVMAKIPCTNSQCRNGSVLEQDAEGNPTKSTCATCEGTSYIPNPGPYQVLIREDGANMGGPVDNRPTIEYVTPPEGTMQHSYEVPWDLFTRAKKAIGLDLLENVGESGIAKAIRLEDLNDLLRAVSDNFFGIMSRHLEIVEGLLVVDEGRRQSPRMRMPTDLQYTSQAILEENAQNALPADRFQSQMDLYAKKYSADQPLLKVYQLTLQWAPILLNSESEISLNLGWGVYQAKDLIKKDNAFIIFKDILDEVGAEAFLKLDKQNAFTKADMVLETMLPDQPGSVSDLDFNSGQRAGETG